MDQPDVLRTEVPSPCWSSEEGNAANAALHVSNACKLSAGLLRAIGSLRLAIILIVVYTGVLIAATTVEKVRGAEAARDAVYQTLWFAALHALLAVNILAAMLVRLPWRWRQAGFLTAHAGILVLLAGCALTWFGGDLGQLSIIEGQSGYHVATEDDTSGFDLGFQVYLRQFRRKLDPASSMASHYSSTVDFLDRSQPPKKLRENVLITLNAPVDFTDPRSGKTYRFFQSGFSGPATPSTEEFNQLLGKDRSRDQIYLSRLTVNYDPGRGLKYAGSLMIVLGMVGVYLRRRRIQPREAQDNSWELTAPGSDATSRGASQGRLAPGYLLVVMLSLVGVSRAEGQSLNWSMWQHLPALAEGRVAPLDSVARRTVEAICGRAEPTLAVGNLPPRKFSAAELLFAWLADPESWENVAFLPAGDAELRRELLGLPVIDAKGRRLTRISPAEIESVRHDKALMARLAKLEKRAKSEGREFQTTRLFKNFSALWEAYRKYRSLTFGITGKRDSPDRFYARLESARSALFALASNSQGAKRISGNPKMRQLLIDSVQSYQKLTSAVRSDEFARKKLEPLAAEFHRVASQLAARLPTGDDRPLVALAADADRQAAELHLSLYENGEALRLVPALDVAALEENRSANEDASPWLSLQTMLYGSDHLLQGYPKSEVDAVRRAYAEAKAAYQGRAGDRAKRFSQAMNRFAAAVRELGERTSPLREKLPILHRDEAAIKATAYPLPGFTSAEVFYNRLDPFFWAWTVGVAATTCVLVAVGRWRRAAFRSGLALLVLAQAFTIAGLGLRAYITGLAPLTGMFESVVVVSLFVALLGLWFTLLPLAGRDLLPNSISPLPLGEGQGVRAVVIAEFPATVSLPSGPNPSPLTKGKGTDMLERRPFLLAGAIVSSLAMVAAYYAPATVMHRNIGAAMPILRDNFWLVVHVTTIMMSYAAAAMAMILGNMGLGYYLFGKYMPLANVGMARVVEGGTRGVLPTLPPAACERLAGFAYSAIQVTVVLLAAGTILGGLWADYSWGRFWAWDPKETWALISLLVYLAFLHARHAGWSGDFGMCLTAVAGFSAVLFTWYGVNFLMSSGMHAYGSGAAGAWPMSVAAVLQLAFLAAAKVRYVVETAR